MGGAILLAAGFSRRFGSDKRRYRLPGGRSMLLASVDLYAGAFPRLAVVLRPEDTDLAAQIRARAASGDGDGDVQIVSCPEARHGMGHSLACGARAAAGWHYVFVALSDMPWVRPQTLEHLRATLAGAGAHVVVQPAYRGTPGHPVGFGADYLPSLARLSGDEGARAVLRDAGPRRVLVAVDDPGVIEDLDRPPVD